MMFIKTAISSVGYIFLSLAPARGSLSLRESEVERRYVCSLHCLLSLLLGDWDTKRDLGSWAFLTWAVHVFPGFTLPFIVPEFKKPMQASSTGKCKAFRAPAEVHRGHISHCVHRQPDREGEAILFLKALHILREIFWKRLWLIWGSIHIRERKIHSIPPKPATCDLTTPLPP